MSHPDAEFPVDPAQPSCEDLSPSARYKGCIKPCQDLADDFSKAGGKVTVKIYPSSSHGFDGNPANTAMFNLRFAENYMDCIVYVETFNAREFAQAILA